MSVENLFQSKLHADPHIEIESNIILVTSPTTLNHFDLNTVLYINDVPVINGTYNLVLNDTFKLGVLSSEHYSKQSFGIIRVDGRIHTFSVVTRSDIEPIHIDQFNGKVPFEMNEYEDGSKLTDNTYAARAYNNKLSTFDKNISIEYPDEQFRLDYSIGENQFNSDTSYVTCSFYTNRVLRHSRRTKRLIASIPVSGHPCEFVEVPNIPSADNVSNLWVTLSDKNKVVVINNGNSVVHEYSVGSYPTGIIYNGTSVFVANLHDNTISKFDYGTEWNSSVISVGNKPFQLALDKNNDVWVTCAEDDRVFKISGNTSIGYVVGDNPRGIVCLDDYVWVTLSKTDKLLKLDLLGNLIQTIDDAGVHPYSISKPILIGDTPATPFERDDWYSSNALIINSEDSFFGGNNNDIQDSSGAFLSINGSPQHISFSPYQDAWSSQFNSSSITLEDNVDTYIGTSDFTIEFWLNFSEISSQGIFHTSHNNLAGSMWCGYRYDGLMFAISGSEGYNSFGFWFTPEVSRWVHVAISRGAGATRIFIDGELRSVTSKLNGVDIKQNGWIIGDNSDASLPFKGFISDFHVTKTCKYVGSSIVNSDKLILDPYSCLYILAGRKFVDESDKKVGISSVFNVKNSHFSPYSLGFSRANNYSGLFSGSSDYIKTTIDVNLGKSDFTFESWVYRNSNGNGKLLELGNLVVRENGAIDGIVGAISDRFSGEWFNLAVVKRDGVYYRYIDGILFDSITNDNHISGRTAHICKDFSGFIMNYRIVFDSVYSGNYILPSKLLVVPNTKVLLKFRNAGVVDVTGKNIIRTENYPYVHSESKFGDYALNFNSKVLTIANNTFWNLFNRDCTIEAHVETTDPNCTILAKMNSTFTSNSWRVKLVDCRLVFEHSGLGLDWLHGTSNVADGMYHHFAIIKEGRGEKLMVDGNREAFKTYCANTFIDFPNVLHEQTTTPIVLRGNMESGDVFDLNSYTTFSIISGNVYAHFDGNNIVVDDIVPDQTITIRAVTTYRDEVFSVEKTVTLEHNPELVSIDIIGPASIIEQDSGQYSIIANMSNGTSYVPDNSLVTWELVSSYASIDTSGLVNTIDIQDSSKIFTLYATYTDNGVESETKSSSKFVTVVYYPELVDTEIAYPANSMPLEGAYIQMQVSGILENGVSGVGLSSNVWSILSGNSYASIDSSGVLQINQGTAYQAVVIRCVSEYVAGIIHNTVTKDFTVNILPDFLGVELLLSGDILPTTTPANLLSVSISGVNSFPEDTTSKYEAFGVFDDGSTRNISAFTNWSVISGNTYATIDNFGILDPIENNILVNRSITIQAQGVIGGIQQTATKNVIIEYVPVLSSVTINSTSFNELVTSSLSATGYWDDGTAFDASGYTVWELVSGTAASVSSNGTIITNEVSSSNDNIRIRASVTRGSTTLTTEKDIVIYNLPKLTSLNIVKGSGTLTSGAFVQFTTVGILEDSNLVNASPYTSWSIQSGVGSIDSSGVLSIPLNSLDEVIVIHATATYQNGTASATYTVTVIDDFINVELLLSGDILSTTVIPALTSITLSGANNVTEQTSSQYSSIAHFNNGGNDIDVSSSHTTWSIVSGASYGSISSTGLFTAANITGGNRSVIIRASVSYRGITIYQDKTITVDIVPVFSGITINGASSVIEQQSTDYTVTGQKDDGSSFDATSYTTWSIISGASYATVNSSGTVTANDVTASDKTIVLRASTTYNSLTFTSDKTITITWQPIFQSVSISGTNSIIEYGYTQLSATGYYDGGTSFDANAYTTWSIVSGASYGSIDSTGLVTATGGVGTIIVEATTTTLSTTKTAQYNISVSAVFPYVELQLSGDILATTLVPTLISGTINGSDTVTEQTSSQYTLTGHFNNGGIDQDLTSSTIWSIVSGASYGSISSTGLFTAANISASNKSVTIRASTTHRGITVTTDKTITVTYIQTFSSVTISGANSVNENSTSQYTATGVMDDGVTFDATAYTTWSIVSGASYGSIDSTGLLTTSNVTANQSITIRATVSYNSTTITQDKVVSVVWVPIFDHIVITGTTPIQTPGTSQYTATGYMEDNTTFAANAYTTWSVITGSPYASIDSNGLLTASGVATNQNITIQATTIYNSITKTATFNILLQTANDQYWSNVAVLLSGENVTPYTDFSLFVAVQLSGEAA